MIRQRLWEVRIAANLGPDGESFTISGRVWAAVDAGPTGAVAEVCKVFGADPTRLAFVEVSDGTVERNRDRTEG